MSQLYRAPIARLAIPLMIVFSILFSLARGFGMNGPGYLRPILPLSFIIMMALPWVLLGPEGRRRCGLRGSEKKSHYLSALLFGGLAAFLCGVFGYALFGIGTNNWYVTIANSYRGMVDTSGFSLLQLHLMFTLPAIFFSPLGEEIFFRGVLQTTLEEKMSDSLSTAIECVFFGLIHLFHHGLTYSGGQFSLLPLSGALWVLLMAGVAFLFAYLRKRSGSILPAIAGHAAFNLCMNTFIFAVLW
ncbi:CPBP family intramembrane glutamic endopeptidase [Pelagicoccus sp. SDUM812003]|uniref:CPBP family intramembrane glutamic endopeptidase n=1 Tax=Pelagicoccus sp. SDUM812003 TaxID=3041267 RepID=UPI00280F3337|nr:CPBP family intramembrane glutamic endopeptidase [Pelagicoccus sp. SDUM812003]MDQ8203898.1 CPBP family intramembrane metalloprotease [Pelagicoccus sp. SDUM812003]